MNNTERQIYLVIDKTDFLHRAIRMDRRGWGVVQVHCIAVCSAIKTKINIVNRCANHETKHSSLLTP